MKTNDKLSHAWSYFFRLGQDPWSILIQLTQSINTGCYPSRHPTLARRWYHVDITSWRLFNQPNVCATWIFWRCINVGIGRCYDVEMMSDFNQHLNLPRSLQCIENSGHLWKSNDINCSEYSQILTGKCDHLLIFVIYIEGEYSWITKNYI